MTNDAQTTTPSTSRVSELMDDIPFAMLTTIDEAGELVSRPMSHQEVEFDGDLWFFAAADSRKVRHITANPHVGVTLASGSTWVSLNGSATIIRDTDKAKQLWSAEIEAWFPDGPDDDSIVLIKVDGETAEYWDTPGGRIASVLSFVKAKATGQRYEGGNNEVVDLGAAG